MKKSENPKTYDPATVAKEIDRVCLRLGPLLVHEHHYVAALALSMLAARHALHDDASEEDFVAASRAAYQRTKRGHMDPGPVPLEASGGPGVSRDEE